MSVQTDVNNVGVTGYYLTNTTPGHHKFYTILITDTGVCTMTWGRIGAEGQSKVVKGDVEEARNIGLRQYHSKLTRGYESKVEGLRFSVPESYVTDACRSQHPSLMNRAFWNAERDPQYTEQTTEVGKQYETFVRQAQNLMDKAAEQPFDAVYAEYEELEKAWTEIDDKHSQAETTVQLIKQMVWQHLMSGGK